MSRGVSIVVPNYNGEKLLREYLPSVVAACAAYGGPSELIVVDDGSTDRSVGILRSEFPGIRLLVNERNGGYSVTCNRGVREASHPLVICINTDVRVEPGFIEPLVRWFDDPSVFAVTPNVLVERQGINQGIVHGGFGKGFLRGGFASIDERPGARENFYAVGACVVYDRERFLALDGYLEIYSPYLFEDVDISYRAWKRGWRSVYEPSVTVWHYASATLSSQKKRFRRFVYFRNRFIFHWINLSDDSWVALNRLHTVTRLLVSFLWLDLNYYRSFLAAAGLLGEIRRLRSREAALRALTDREVVSRTRKSPSGNG